MIRFLIFVFACISAAATAAPLSLDAAKLRLLSANAVVLDAADGEAIGVTSSAAFA